MTKLFTIIAILCFTVHDLTAQFSLTSGLVAHYPFSGNVKDLSSFNAEGSIVNALLTDDRFGKSNSAYNFSGMNSYISIPAENLDLSTYTYSLWVKADKLPGDNQYNCAISIGTFGSDQAIGICKNCAGGEGWGYISYPSISFSSAVLPTVNKWYHVVATRENQKVLFYIDGDVIGGAGGAPINSTPGITGTIGARYNKQELFNGDIDDVRIYNRAFNSEEVKTLFNIESQTITAVNEAFYTEVIICPNPTNGEFQIYSDLSAQDFKEILIKDITGKLINANIGQKFGNSVHVNFSGESGLYFLEYQNSNGKQVVKFLKN